MQYWWVNQNQTYKHEVPGGYMWSPKRQTDGHKNRAYELMKSVRPGDIVFSFAEQHIKAIGIAKSYCYEFPKPTEFGNAGEYWDNIGWRVDVHFNEISNPLKPKDYINTLRKLLPVKYSPLQQSGDGNQVYLFDISKELAVGVSELIDRRYVDLVNGNVVAEKFDIDESLLNLTAWEDQIEQELKSNEKVTKTEYETLVKARRGQGRFRNNVLTIESYCRITKVDNPEHLIASHIKPWRDGSNDERIDAENGLMLTPTIDHLFDKGFISFESNGELLISSVAHEESMKKMHIPKQKYNVGSFTDGQKNYLDFHRENIFLERD